MEFRDTMSGVMVGVQCTLHTRKRMLAVYGHTILLQTFETRLL